MNVQQYKEFLLSNIKPWAKPASGGKVINCRCFYCRDSDNPSHGHFYISMPTNKQPSLYYCQKCKASGKVSPFKLMDWGIYDSNIAIELAILNKSVSDNYIYNGGDTRYSSYNIRNTSISLSEDTDKKLQYLSQRLGYSITYQDCIDLKIVLNIFDIIKSNNLNLTRDSRIVSTLDSDFVGFLSKDNSCVNMRNINMRKNIHPFLNKRYINYNLIQTDNITSRRFYTIPTNIRLDSCEPIKIHVAEGPFDILSILLNLRKNNKQSIFTSINGSGYGAVLEYFINLLNTPNIEIHVYPDNDVSRNDMVNIRNKLFPFNYPFYIHRNVYPKQKDFGVPLNKINESVELL